MSLFDPAKSRPASIYPTIALLNNFLLVSQDFLNTFSEQVDQKMSSVSNKITQLDILLRVVEAKLNSIPDTNITNTDNTSATVVSLPPVISETIPQTIQPQSSQIPQPSVPPPPARIEHTSSVVGTIVEEVDESSINDSPAAVSGKVEASSHPKYAPFMKMLKVGVPPPVVANKLADAGLDESVVYDPSKLVDAS